MVLNPKNSWIQVDLSFDKKEEEVILIDPLFLRIFTKAEYIHIIRNLCSIFSVYEML